jgi:AraC-like DNA-binding protein
VNERSTGATASIGAGAHPVTTGDRPKALDPTATPADPRPELQAIKHSWKQNDPSRIRPSLSDLAHQRRPAAPLSQLVNRGRGRNFSDWVNRYRLAEAQRLLADPSSGIRSVLDAMYAAGFSSKSTFNALFKASSGVTPTEFMRQHRPQTGLPKK